MNGGALVLCGTPIGNLEDMSPRAVRALREADVVACEDTRRTKKLLTHHGISARELVVYNEQTERRRSRELLARVEGGERVVLVSDAGMPGLSDPGYRLVRACADAGVTVTAVPGPSAPVTALSVSGLPPGRFVFEGFLPRRSGDRRRRIEELKKETRTLVFFESPHRIVECLRDLDATLGDRPAVLARELTKLHEEIRRGTLSEQAAGVDAEPPRGEMVVVVGGAVGSGREPVPPEVLAGRARALMESGIDRKEALSRVAKEAGVPRREVFDSLLGEEG